MRPRDTNKRKNNKASEERPARAAILLTSSRAPGPRTHTCPSSMMLPFPPALRFLGSRLRPSRSPERPALGFLSCQFMHFKPPEWTCSYCVPGPAVTSSAFASTCPHSLTHREASRRSVTTGNWFRPQARAVRIWGSGWHPFMTQRCDVHPRDTYSFPPAPQRGRGDLRRAGLRRWDPPQEVASTPFPWIVPRENAPRAGAIV